MGKRDPLAFPYKRLRGFEGLKAFLEEAQKAPAPVFTQGGSSRKHPGARRAGMDAGTDKVSGSALSSTNAGVKANV